jgi:hypothetical protein
VEPNNKKAPIKIRTLGDGVSAKTPGSSRATTRSPMIQFFTLGLVGVVVVLGLVWSLREALKEDKSAAAGEMQAAAEVLPTPTPNVRLVLGSLKTVSLDVKVSGDLTEEQLRGVIDDSSRTLSDVKQAFGLLANRKVKDCPIVAYLGFSRGDATQKIYFIRSVLAQCLGNEDSDTSLDERADADLSSAIATVLAQGLVDQDSPVRVEAARALARLGDSLALKPLSDQLEIEKIASAKLAMLDAVESINGYAMRQGNNGGQGASS